MSSLETSDISARSCFSHFWEPSQSFAILPALTPFRNKRRLSYFNSQEEIRAINSRKQLLLQTSWSRQMNSSYLEDCTTE
jgi:hypothetical protein